MAGKMQQIDIKRCISVYTYYIGRFDYYFIPNFKLFMTKFFSQWPLFYSWHYNWVRGSLLPIHFFKPQEPSHKIIWNKLHFHHRFLSSDCPHASVCANIIFSRKQSNFLTIIIDFYIYLCYTMFVYERWMAYTCISADVSQKEGIFYYRRFLLFLFLLPNAWSL